MPTTEELLAQLEAEAQSETPVCVIDPETRTITVPPEYQLLGVENDKRVERILFRCPKIVGDNQDLSQDYILFVNYVNANGDPDAYKINDMQVEGDNITFSWLLEENVTLYQGNIQISFCGIIPGDEQEDPDKNRWGTTINTDCTVLTGLKCTQQVAESNPDALAQIWSAIDELKAGGGGGSYTLPIMSDTQLGGGKAVAKTDEDVPVAVDTETGQLFVPTYPSGGVVEKEWALIADITPDGETAYWEYTDLPDYEELVFITVGLTNVTESTSSVRVSINEGPNLIRLDSQKNAGASSTKYQRGSLKFNGLFWEPFNASPSNREDGYYSIQTPVNTSYSVKIGAEKCKKMKISIAGPIYMLSGGNIKVYAR